MESQGTSSMDQDPSKGHNGMEDRPDGDESKGFSQIGGKKNNHVESVNSTEISGEDNIQGADSAESLLRSELAEFKDRYMRLLAEVENMRRRMEREKADLMKFAFEGLFKDLLPALDSLEKALPSQATQANKSGDVKDAYFEGMIMVKRQLLEILKRHGLEKVQAAGAEFDPNIHQAIQRIESKEATKDMVKDEFALGYTLHGRLLRPAMVSVLTPSSSE
jgi:molecular chaperone GrpE